MGVEHQHGATVTQGQVMLYARDARWRRSAKRCLEKAGHSCDDAGDADDLAERLRRRRYDVLALRVGDEDEARSISDQLQELPWPTHTILLGCASALPLAFHRRPGGTFRYSPGSLPADELGRLVDITIRSGAWDDAECQGSGGLTVEEVDVQELIDSVASVVYEEANRKRQRFRSTIAAPTTLMFADRTKLRKALTSILRLVVRLAPNRSLISVDVAGDGEWVIRVSATNGRTPASWPAFVVDELLRDASVLTTTSKSLLDQGGMLWVDLMGAGAVAISMRLPGGPERSLQAATNAPARRKEVER